jgi:YD repeat-containing protein
MAGTWEAAITGNGAGLTGGSSPSVAISETSVGDDNNLQQQVIDPRSIVSKTDYDMLGRTVDTIQDFVSFAPSNSSDRTTSYQYDGDNNVTFETANLPARAIETTEYVYGVTPTTGSDITSNDLIYATEYPSQSNGLPSNSNEIVDEYDALGEVNQMTDRNGNVHAYSFDVLGRTTSDAVTTFGTGVDTTVQDLQYAYDGEGNLDQYTSYSAPTGGTVLNQVDLTYNGLGQLTQDQQAHSGSVGGRHAERAVRLCGRLRRQQ